MNNEKWNSKKENNNNNNNYNQNYGKQNKKQKTEIWSSGVQIKQCRYLHESSCKAACVKLCKLPTQEFFRDLNIPLTMVPDFTDSSCQMMFGQSAPSLTEEDPVIQELLQSKSPCILLEKLGKNG